MFDRSRVEPRAAGNRANQVSGYDEAGMTIAIVVDRSSKGGRGYFDLLQEDHERFVICCALSKQPPSRASAKNP
jgi:hypothetical protein